MDPEKYNAPQRARYAANPEKYRAQARARRARRYDPRKALQQMQDAVKRLVAIKAKRARA